MLKRKDQKIFEITSKLKKVEKELEGTKSRCQQVEYELSFFKDRMQEEIQSQNCTESDLGEIAGVMKSLVRKMSNVFDQDQSSMIALENHLQEMQNTKSYNQL